MEILSVKNLSFKYPGQDIKALDNINLSVREGEFVVVCGRSGSGKTTLLRMLKKETAPHGEKSGSAYYNNNSLEEISHRISAEKIGFVFQKPEQQIVTDKVWHELAFGLESLGYDSQYIRLRVGEMANYFGIARIFRSGTDKLSGGEKQLVNLASVMAMSPDVLILDEPTSQLDPIAARDFTATLRRLNSEFGLTVILTEHRLQEVFPCADRVAVLDEGRLIAFDTPKNVCKMLPDHPVSAGFPSAVRIWQASGMGGECPLTVKEGRSFINSNYAERDADIHDTAPNTEVKISLRDVFFRYEKNSPDVLRGTNLNVHRGEHFVLLGGNGSGKTTTLKILAGIVKPYRGKVIMDGRTMSRKSGNTYSKKGIAMLPQNPETVFIKSSVYDDYEELCKINCITGEKAKTNILELSKAIGVSHLLNKHPYDLSGGELQKCAIGKILLSNPDILLLDEPTKGMDAYCKAGFGKFLLSLKSNGVTIITVTHDIEFAAENADRCALFFDGEVLSPSVPQRFFSKNDFYTTSASRIARDKFPGAVTVEDVTGLIAAQRS